MRADHDMPFILKYENVAWYEDGEVRILDRRCYPYKINFVSCTSYQQVAQAIKDMVTQSAGPYTAAGMGMALAAYEARDLSRQEKIEFLEKAAKTISTARPTTQARMEKVTGACLAAGRTAIEKGEDPLEAILSRTYRSLDERYERMQVVAGHLVDNFPENPIIMTQCYGETIVGTMLRELKERKIDAKFIVPETRPFLQGARLTASAIKDMDFDLRVISDNMVAWAMDYYGVDVFTSAADSITRDGYVVNKVGTFGMAIIAKHLGIPYLVTGIPDDERIEGLEIEFRDPNEVLCHSGKKMTMDGVKAIYPAFDTTPPDLVAGYVTDKGTLSFEDLEGYYQDKEEFY